MVHPIDREIAEWPTWRLILTFLFIILYLGAAAGGFVLIVVHIVQWLKEVG
jgi:hypothetical protein